MCAQPPRTAAAQHHDRPRSDGLRALALRAALKQRAAGHRAATEPIGSGEREESEEPRGHHLVSDRAVLAKAQNYKRRRVSTAERSTETRIARSARCVGG